MNESKVPFDVRATVKAATLRGACACLLATGLALTLSPWAAAQSTDSRNDNRNNRNGDYIAAVVNQELVTAGEVERRLERALAEASRAGGRTPNTDDLRRNW